MFALVTVMGPYVRGSSYVCSGYSDGTLCKEDLL